MSSLLDWATEMNKKLSNGYILEMQQERYEIFKSQNPEKDDFDVTFEVEEKKLYAHSFMLTSVSDYMKAALSDRWSKKDEPVKTESYSYENFYEFLCFIYSGHCKINKSNALQLVDMAEFYGVSSFKKFCVKSLSSMEKTVENIEEIFEIAVKYSLHDLKYSIKDQVHCLGNSLYKAEKFLKFKKPFVQYLSTVDRDPDCPAGRGFSSNIKESKFFECVYKWAENRVMKEKDVADKDFNLLESIKAELNTILARIEFAEMSFQFLMDFVLEKGFFLSSTELKKFFENYRDWKHYKNRKSNSMYNYADVYSSDDEYSYYYSSDDESSDDENPDDKNSATEETFLKTVFELAKKQALKKQEMTPDDETFNLAESIRSDLVEVIPLVKFNEMDKTFLKDFVVANGILSEEQFKCVFDTRVYVNDNGKFICGLFKDNLGIHDAIKTYPCFMTQSSTTTIRFLKLKFPVPETQSTVKKNSLVEWYLCLDKDGILSFKHKNVIDENDYLLAEMKSYTKFNLVPDTETYVIAYYNNVPDL